MMVWRVWRVASLVTAGDWSSIGQLRDVFQDRGVTLITSSQDFLSQLSKPFLYRVTGWGHGTCASAMRIISQIGANLQAGMASCPPIDYTLT